jgi:hypothetical protein
MFPCFNCNGLIISSNCVKKALVSNPYGLTVTKTTMADFGGDQASVIFTCNKPMCNSKEVTQQVMQQLVAAQLIPQPAVTSTVAPTPPPTTTTMVVPTAMTTTMVDPTVVTTTTTMDPTATTPGTVSTTATTPPRNMGNKMLNSEQTLLVSFFLLFSFF